jgi:hypothetical protein
MLFRVKNFIISIRGAMEATPLLDGLKKDD